MTTGLASSSSSARITRYTAIGALTIAVAVVVVLLLSGGSSYTLHARLTDASGLVSAAARASASHLTGSPM